MKNIRQGLTNYSYLEDNNFFQQKTHTGFNHLIDYSILEKFDFVPKLLSNNHKTSSWEYIDGQEPTINEKNLIKIAEILKKLHNSKLDFPKFNIRKRINEYLKILKNKAIKIEKIDSYYRRINKILSNSKTNTPCHNDLWPRNMILQNDKLFIIDWEYATMNDKHFDLAYFIESSNLSDEQETIFLNAYDDYNYEYILQQKILVNYLVVLWVNAQDKKHFDDKPYIDKLDVLHNQILERRKNSKK